MRPISGWFHMMSSRVGVAPKTGDSAGGPSTYGSTTFYPAHIVRESRLVRNMAGDEVLSKQQAYLGTNLSFGEDSLVTLSTADAGSTEAYAIHPPIVAVQRRFDQTGPHHTILHLALEH